MLDIVMETLMGRIKIYLSLLVFIVAHVAISYLLIDYLTYNILSILGIPLYLLNTILFSFFMDRIFRKRKESTKFELRLLPSALFLLAGNILGYSIWLGIGSGRGFLLSFILDTTYPWIFSWLPALVSLVWLGCRGTFS